MEKQAKTVIVENLQREMSQAGAIFLINFNAITVKEISQLRRSLRQQQTGLKVVKNTLLKRALAAVQVPAQEDLLTGQTALAWTKGDFFSSLKVLASFKPENGQWEIKGGIIDGQETSREDLKRLSQLPSREALLGLLVRGVKAPISNLVYVLKALLRQLVGDLNEIKKNKEVKQ